jgi:uncharacterized glyoxalase superfamily protein PhnB
MITGLAYVSLYIEDLEAAVEFYSRVFGPPAYTEDTPVRGWRIGDTWLTLFPASAGSAGAGNPRGVEFAIRLASPEEVDSLYIALIDAGAKPCMKPRDTKMYEPMRFGCVDDPFGVRIDVYCPIG